MPTATLPRQFYNTKSDGKAFPELPSDQAVDERIETDAPASAPVTTAILPLSVSLEDYLRANELLLIGQTLGRFHEEQPEGEEPPEESLAESDTETEDENCDPLVTNSDVLEATTILLGHCNQKEGFGILKDVGCLVRYRNEAMRALDGQRRQQDICQFFTPSAN